VKASAICFAKFTLIIRTGADSTTPLTPAIPEFSTGIKSLPRGLIMMRTKTLGTLFPLMLALLFLTAAPNLHARIATGVLEGTVLDSSGHPLSGATVTIQTSDGNHPHATHTDAQGHFSFTHFATGQYDVRAYHQGAYSDWSKRIVIHAAKPASLTLRILPAKP
jgi:protocatechuate 3,4-dioxygenase beta subunit